MRNLQTLVENYLEYCNAQKCLRIWNNTIPLLKNHVFIGSDANTFALDKPWYFFSAAYVYDRCTNQ